MNIIQPMLACPSTGTAGRPPIRLTDLGAGWAFCTKLDGMRAILTEDRRLLTRTGVDVAHLFPEVMAQPAPSVTLDGEIIADDGRFTTVATRVKQPARRVAAAVLSMPCRFIAFDVLTRDDTELMDLPWRARRDILDDLGVPVTPYAPASDRDKMWNAVVALGLEGLIAKRVTSRYQPGVRSRDWIKLKVIRRVTCLATGYRPGQGSRAHFGAMTLALIGPDGLLVDVGSVGSGFSAADITELKTLLDSGQRPLVEIEALNVTAAGKLRFPVYVGLRHDLPLSGASTDQLAALPTC